MDRTPPAQVWTGLLSPDWLARIEATDQVRLFLWGGLYLTMWGLALFAWTVHAMVFWLDLAAQAREERHPEKGSGAGRQSGSRAVRQ
jgi:hypothetical protein